MIQAVKVTIDGDHDCTVGVRAKENIVLELEKESAAIVTMCPEAEELDDPLTVTFSGFEIQASGDDAKIHFITDVAISSNYYFRAEGEEVWLEYNVSANLTLSHYVIVEGPFAEDVTFEFKAFGSDIEGTVHTDSAKQFSKTDGDYAFTEA